MYSVPMHNISTPLSSASLAYFRTIDEYEPNHAPPPSGVMAARHSPVYRFTCGMSRILILRARASRMPSLMSSGVELVDALSPVKGLTPDVLGEMSTEAG